MTCEAFPAKILSKLMTRVDFFYDTAVKKAFAAAEKSEDARSVAEALRTYKDLGVPQKRLVHSAPDAAQDNALLRMSLPIALPGLCFLDSDFVMRPGGAAVTANEIKTIRNLLSLRKELKTAEGTIQVKKSQRNTLVIENHLPGGGIWLVAVNFSRGETVRIPLQESRVILDLATKSRPEEMTNSSGQRILTLKPREARHIFLGAHVFSRF